jgi:hypothetical protein
VLNPSCRLAAGSKPPRLSGHYAIDDKEAVECGKSVGLSVALFLLFAHFVAQSFPQPTMSLMWTSTVKRMEFMRTGDVQEVINFTIKITLPHVVDLRDYNTYEAHWLLITEGHYWSMCRWCILLKSTGGGACHGDCSVSNTLKISLFYE